MTAAIAMRHLLDIQATAARLAEVWVLRPELVPDDATTELDLSTAAETLAALAQPTNQS